MSRPSSKGRVPSRRSFSERDRVQNAVPRWATPVGLSLVALGVLVFVVGLNARGIPARGTGSVFFLYALALGLAGRGIAYVVAAARQARADRRTPVDPKTFD